jgi:hypothetical protein
VGRDWPDRRITGILGVYGGPDLIIDYPNGDKAAYIGTIFRGKITGGTLRPDGDEILDVRYVAREEFTATPHSKWMDTPMPALFTRDSPTHFRRSSWTPE